MNDRCSRGASIEPLFELGNGDEDAAPAADDAKLGKDVLVEIVAADAEDGGRLLRTEREPRPERPAGGGAARRLRLRRLLDPAQVKFELSITVCPLRRAHRHQLSVADRCP